MPTAIHAHQTASWAFFAVAVAFFAVTLGWCVRALTRDRDPIPLIAFAGGAIASLEESWIDSMIKLFYPHDAPLVAFTAFKTPQPVYLHLIYPGFVGLGAYVVYRRLAGGGGTRVLKLAFGGICLLDLAFELPATATRVFVYYGHQPFQLFHLGWPLWVAPINAAGPVLGGVMIYVLAPRMQGSARWVLALMPPLAYAGVYAATGWPEFTMLNADVPGVVRWLAALVTIGLCCAIVTVLASSLPDADRLATRFTRRGATAGGMGERAEDGQAAAVLKTIRR